MRSGFFVACKLRAPAGFAADRRPLRDWIHAYNVTPCDLREVVEKYLGKQES